MLSFSANTQDYSENSISATKKLKLLPLKHFRSPALLQAFYFYIPYGIKQIDIV